MPQTGRNARLRRINSDLLSIIWIGVLVTILPLNGLASDAIMLTGGSGWGTLPVAFSTGRSGMFHVYNEAVGDFGNWATLGGVARLVGDFDGDGSADIALAGGSGWIS